jgi:hypothetical protein
MRCYQPFLLISLLILLYSCDNKKSSETNIYNALNGSLERSNRQLEKSSEMIEVAMKDKVPNPVFHEKAIIGLPKIEKVRILSREVYNYIEGLKTLLSNETSAISVDKIMNTERKGTELFRKLKLLRIALLGADPHLTQEISSMIEFWPTSFDSISSDSDLITEKYFRNVPLVGVLAVLSKFQNDIRITENRLCTLFHEQFTNHGWTHEWPHALIGQSTRYIKPGDPIEITAGIGEFKRVGRPEVKINGKKVVVNEYGYAEYLLKPSSVAGKHSIPIEMSYLDQDGKENRLLKTIEYTVVND